MLLVSLEELPVDKAATMVGIEPEEAETLLASGRDRLRDATATDVLIIEDEPIIAMEIEELVQSCGHRIVGVAATERDAVEIAKRTRPGLILADINLGAGGDGTSAVARIMQSHYAPVIFVTAYPERLLTGRGGRARLRHHQAVRPNDPGGGQLPGRDRGRRSRISATGPPARSGLNDGKGAGYCEEVSCCASHRWRPRASAI